VDICPYFLYFAASKSSGHSSMRPGPVEFVALVASGEASSAMVSSGRSVPTKKFSVVEITNSRAKGLCFHYDEKFVLGHREAWKWMFITEVVSGEEDLIGVEGP
jgi:hypothetical protein